MTMKAVFLITFCWLAFCFWLLVWTYREKEITKVTYKQLESFLEKEIITKEEYSKAHKKLNFDLRNVLK